MNNRASLRRRGVAVLIVLVVLLVFGVAMTLAMQANLAARAESRRAAQRLQAEYLATAGLELALARLHADAAYAGETWPVAASELGGRENAAVQIEVAIAADQSNYRRVTVVATYPVSDEPWRQQRYRLEYTWNSSSTSQRSEP